MTCLYVHKQGARVSLFSGRLVVKLGEEKLQELPMESLENLSLMGNVSCTAPVMGTLLAGGVDVAWFNASGSRLKGRLCSRISKNIPLRLEQYSIMNDGERKLLFARKFLFAHFRNMLRMLEKLAANHPGTEMKEVRRKLRETGRKILREKEVSSIRGYEGMAARTYFEMLGKYCRGELKFKGRNRRPPRDPFNALLSLSYTLVTRELADLLEGNGFDPCLGFLHEISYGRISLACDLVEEFRAPLADRFVLNLCNRNMLREKDFVKDKKTGGVFLVDKAKGLYYGEYGRFMDRPFSLSDEEGPVSFRHVMRRQVERLKAAIMKSEEYKAFEF